MSKSERMFRLFSDRETNWTPWNRVILDTVSHSDSQEIPRFLRNPKIHYRVKEPATDLALLRGCIQRFPDGVDNEINIKINTCLEGKQRIMAAKLTRQTHKIVIQLHLVAESCTICSSRSRLPVLKLLDTPSYFVTCTSGRKKKYETWWGQYFIS
jgi:hypothetical protein